MKFNSYQRSVEANNTMNPNIRRSGDINAYGTNGNGYTALAEGLNKVNEAYIKQKENELVVATTEANNEYNSRINNLLYNEKDGLMYKELGNAKNLTNEFQEAESKIRNEIMQKVPSYEKAHLAFNAMSDKSVMQHLKDVQNRQYEQGEKHKGIVYDNNIVNTVDMAVKSQNPEQIFNSISNIRAVTTAMYLDKKGEEAVNLLVREKSTDMVVKSVKEILANGNAGDFDNAEVVLKMTEKYIDPSEVTNLRSMIATNKKMNEDIELIKQGLEMFGDDPDAFEKWLINNNTVEEKVKKGNNLTQFDIPLSTGDNPDIEGLRPELKSSLGSIGGVINSLGLADGALITSGNRDEARNAAAGGAENSWHKAGNALDIYFPDLTADQQNELIEEFKPYFGEVLYHDAGSGYHLHLGNYQGGLDDVKEETVTVAKYSPKEIEDKKNAFIAAMNKRKQLENIKKVEFIDGAMNTMLQMYKDGNRSPEAYRQYALTAAGTDAEVFKSLMNTASSLLNADYLGIKKNGNGSSVGWKVKGNIKEAIGMGVFKTKQELVDCLLDSGMNDSQIEVFVNAYDNFKQGKGEYSPSFDWGEIKSSVQVAAGLDSSSEEWKRGWIGAKQYASGFITDYKINNGHEPSPDAVINAAVSAFTKQTFIDPSGQFDSIEISPQEMQRAGIEKILNNQDGTATMYWKDGTHSGAEPLWQVKLTVMQRLNQAQENEPLKGYQRISIDNEAKNYDTTMYDFDFVTGELDW